MARAATAGTSLTTRLVPPADFTGTPTQWRVLTETIWPSAKSAEAIQLAIGYCAARHLDPFKRPVHIVPVWNSALRREVETVWPGINELLTTAARSQSFAGVDEPEWGPDDTRTFSGTERINDRDVPVSLTVTFPIWCSVRVWRHVQGERRAFSQPVFWMEAYGRRGFRSELPNAMWEKRPKGQLHKCALAAALRLGFPEDLGSEYAAEEMEGREVDHGGVVIEGKAEPPPASIATTAPPPPPPDATPAPPGEATDATADLEETDTGRWLKALERRLEAAPSLDAVAEIERHPSVQRTLEEAPTLIRRQIEDWLRKAAQRLAPPPADDEWPDDPIRELLAKIEAMDLEGLQTVPVSAAWKVKTRDLFPPDLDRINEAVRDRIAVLKSQGNK